MRIEFTADEGSFEADEYALVCGVAGGEHWLTFQRDAEDSPDDWGIHLEYSGQANGGYGCIAACRVGPESLSVDLNQQLGRLVGVTGFDVAMRLRTGDLEAVKEGLGQIFRGYLHLLTSD